MTDVQFQQIPIYEKSRIYDIIFNVSYSCLFSNNCKWQGNGQIIQRYFRYICGVLFC